MAAKKKQETGLQTKELTDWQKKLADKAKNARAMVVQGVSRITHKGGELQIDGKSVQGNKLPIIIIDSILANEYYTTKFVEGVPCSPDCYAFGTDAATMAPHPEAPEKQSETCAACPQNVYGTADGGNRAGKACRNTVRLLVVTPSDNPEAYAKQEKRQISVPPTSLKQWGKFQTELTDLTVTGSPMEVVTELSTRRKGSFHELTFEVKGKVPEKNVEAIFNLSEKSAGLLSQPFPKLEAPEAPAPRNARKSRKLD